MHPGTYAGNKSEEEDPSGEAANTAPSEIEFQQVDLKHRGGHLGTDKRGEGGSRVAKVRGIGRAHKEC